MPVLRFPLVVSIVLAAAVSTRADSTAPQPAASAVGGKTNFLVILCDDLGYGDLGCFGHPSIQTPNLDRLAAQGVRLTDCYAAAPVCSPSRAGLPTGRHPNRFGVYDWIPSGSPMHMGRGEITIAQLLQRAGYATGHFGKWHCNGRFNTPRQPQPGDQGFDYWFSTQNNAHPHHRNPTNFVRNGQPVGPTEGYSCQVVTEEAIAWLRTKRPASMPFFAFVCFHEPHEIVASPPELVARYPDAKNEKQATYFANVTNVDLAVGRLLAALDELGEADRTFVMFTSDNGPETLDRYPTADHSYGSSGPLRGMKLHIYEGGIRVPGIIRFPGRTRAGQVVTEPIGSVDLLPTFCEIAGIEPPRDRTLDGASILPIFDGKRVARTAPLFWLYAMAISPPKVALRDGDWKLVAHLDRASEIRSVSPDATRTLKQADLVEFELYNLRADVAERHDLARDEPGRVEALSARMRATLREIQSECPIWPAWRLPPK